MLVIRSCSRCRPEPIAINTPRTVHATKWHRVQELAETCAQMSYVPVLGGAEMYCWLSIKAMQRDHRNVGKVGMVQAYNTLHFRQKGDFKFLSESSSTA